MMNNSSQPLVSVIVLTYKKFDNIEENLNSILEQDYSNMEIIIQDDGSPNFPLQRIEDFFMAHNISVYKIEHNEINLGTVRNYNHAMDISNGEIIIPLSQDDRFYDSHCVSDIVGFFQNSNYCICTAQRVGSNSGIVFPSNTQSDILKENNLDHLIFCLFIQNFISGSVLYFRKNDIQRYFENHFFDERFLLLEDYPFLLNSFFRGLSIGFLERPVILYGENGVSSSHSPISSLFVNDKLVLYNNYILPRIERIKNRTIRKFVQYRYFKELDAAHHLDGERSRTAIHFVLRNPGLLYFLISNVFFKYRSDIDPLSALYLRAWTLEMKS